MNYPIGIQDFAKLRENNFVYVDKTDMVFDITKNDGVYFLSRPQALWQVAVGVYYQILF